MLIASTSRAPSGAGWRSRSGGRCCLSHGCHFVAYMALHVSPSDLCHKLDLDPAQGGCGAGHGLTRLHWEGREVL